MPFVLTTDHRRRGPHLEAKGFSGDGDALWWESGPVAARLPPRISFVQSELSAISDLPPNSLACPVWSNRLRSAVESAGPVDWECVPVVVHDSFEPSEVRDDFSLVHVLHPAVRAVDTTNTCASGYAFNPQQWESVEGFRLARTPDAAAFRIVELPTFVILSDAAAEAVRRSGARGIALVPTDEFCL